MKMKLFFAAVAVLFTVGVVTSCGNKKAAATAEEATEQVCASTKAGCTAKADSVTCDSEKACCTEKADSVACDSKKACCTEKAEAAK